MAIDPRKELAKFYKDAIEELVASLDRNVWGVPSNPRHLALIAEAKLALDKLDRLSASWVQRFIRTTFKNNVEFINDFLTAKGYSKAELKAAMAHTTLNEQVIELLINDPVNGISPRLMNISRRLNQSIQSYVQQSKALLSQNRLIRRRVAMNVFMGEGSAVARDEVLRTLMNNNAPSEFMGLDRWGGGSAARTLVEAPYYKVMTKNGPRRLHIFDHVQMTVTTTENAVRTKARNSRIQEVGIKLVRITPNPPLTPCVCSLYAGRIFSLDKETGEKTGFPWIGNLPNGGPPFHPYCTHSTIPFIPGAMDIDEMNGSMKNGDRNTKVLRGGLPKALIGKDFNSAQRYFKKRGGMKYSARQNSQIKNFSYSRRASPEVREALKTRRRKKRYGVNNGTAAGNQDLPAASAPSALDILRQEDFELWKLLEGLQ